MSKPEFVILLNSPDAPTKNVGGAWLNKYGGLTLRLDPGFVLDWRLTAKDSGYYINLAPNLDAYGDQQRAICEDMLELFDGYTKSKPRRKKSEEEDPLDFLRGLP